MLRGISDHFLSCFAACWKDIYFHAAPSFVLVFNLKFFHICLFSNALDSQHESHGTGHPDFDIHSGEAAVIKPRLVHFGKEFVVGVAAAKHHMLAVTRSGGVFSWGCNRDGRLGYLGVDTQPTPRRFDSAFRTCTLGFKL